PRCPDCRSARWQARPPASRRGQSGWLRSWSLYSCCVPSYRVVESCAGDGCQHAPDFERQMQQQAIVGVVEVQPGQFGNTFQTVDQRVPVNIEVAGGFRQIAIGLEKPVQRADQIGLLALVIFNQWPQRRLMEAAQVIE